jgi:phosphonate transport system ATP-binding protein
MNALEPHASQQSPVISITELSKTYPNGTRALDAVSLNVYADQFVAIIGRSGAGKSTLLRCLNRLIDATSGRILLQGHDITHTTGRSLRMTRQRVGMIFQQFNLVNRLTVIENVLAGRLRFNASVVRSLRSLIRWFPRGEREHALQCLASVGIERLAFQRADTLSGGQQQRVAIARVLAQEPDVILADEPIASLDPHSARQVMERLRDIHHQQSIPVIINLHQVDIATSYANRIIGMLDGSVVFDGDPSELSEQAARNVYGGILPDDESAEAPSSPPVKSAASIEKRFAVPVVE